MVYTSNKTINGLEAETTIADGDELIFGDITDTNRAKKITFANLKTEIVGDDTAFIRKADYNANTILYATADDTPLALTVGTNSVVGRVAGAITTFAVDSDLTSVSTADDTVASAKAIKTALDLKANDADVVHDTGNETIAGVKTFSSDPLIPDEAYGAGWDNSLEPPTKNAVYDKIESLTIPEYGVYTASDSLLTSADTERTGTSNNYEKVKEMKIVFTGTYRVKFDLSNLIGASNAYGRIYKNGVAFGTERTLNSTSYTTYSEDLAFTIGDTLELWARVVSGGGDSYKVRNLRLYGTKTYIVNTTITD